MSTIYSLKPIIDTDKLLVEVPRCMYNLKNIHGDDGHLRKECRILPNVTEQVINFLKAPLPEVAALEKRQENILTQLAELKEQVLRLCNVLKENNKNESNKVIDISEPAKKRDFNRIDLILNVNPAKPCYSVLAINKIWNDIDFLIESHVSSTGNAKVPDLFKNTESTGKSHLIKLPIIWNENVIDTSLMLSGIHSYPVMGEVNFLRYLCRLLGYENYESPSNKNATIEMDTIFDLAHELIYETNPKKIQQKFSILNTKLSKDAFFLKKNYPGIIDVAVWSAIKQTSPKLSQNLVSWFAKCDKVFLN